MTEKNHDPQTSTAYVVRYLMKDPEKNERVKTVSGEKEAVKWLEKLQKEEKEPKKYRYLWQWKDPDAALAYDLAKLEKEQSR